MNPGKRLESILAENEENSWGMIDILTLMLVFFIILYIAEKGGTPPWSADGGGKVMMEAPVERLSMEGPVAKSASAPDFAIQEGHGVSGQGGAQVAASPAAMLSHHFADLVQEGFSLSGNAAAFTLTLEERLAFASGRAELGAAAGAILERLAGLLVREGHYQVIVSGHTDDLPINNSRFASNWYLSTARAVAVAEELLAAGSIDPGRVVAQGYAEHRPKAPNDSPENRARNRRVEITLYASSKR